MWLRVLVGRTLLRDSGHDRAAACVSLAPDLRSCVELPQPTPRMSGQSTLDESAQDTNTFYRRTLHVLSDAAVPFLVGGSHAFLEYTGIVRNTKDFDLFLRRDDLDRAMDALAGRGLPHRADLSALARQGVAARRLRRPRLQLGQRRLHGRRRLVRPRRRDAGARHAGEDRAVRGAALAEGVRHGARALRRRGHHAHPARRAAAHSIGTATARRASARTGRCSTRTCCSFTSCIRATSASLPVVACSTICRAAWRSCAPRRPRIACARARSSAARSISLDIGQYGYADARLAPRGGMSPEDAIFWTWAIDHVK